MAKIDEELQLKARIQHYIDRINQDPVIYRWKYRLDDTLVV